MGANLVSWFAACLECPTVSPASPHPSHLPVGFQQYIGVIGVHLPSGWVKTAAKSPGNQPWCQTCKQNWQSGNELRTNANVGVWDRAQKAREMVLFISAWLRSCCSFWTWGKEAGAAVWKCLCQPQHSSGSLGGIGECFYSRKLQASINNLWRQQGAYASCEHEEKSRRIKTLRKDGLFKVYWQLPRWWLRMGRAGEDRMALWHCKLQWGPPRGRNLENR